MFEDDEDYLQMTSIKTKMITEPSLGHFDNPTIGLLICRSKNNMFAQYCLEGYTQPIAVTAYEGIGILPANFNDTLPSIEDLKNEIKRERQGKIIVGFT